MKERRKMLQEVMVEVGNYIKFSEAQLITKKPQLSRMIMEVLSKGLEGLVLKGMLTKFIQYETGITNLMFNVGFAQM